MTDFNAEREWKSEVIRVTRFYMDNHNSDEKFLENVVAFMEMLPEEQMFIPQDWHYDFFDNLHSRLEWYVSEAFQVIIQVNPRTITYKNIDEDGDWRTRNFSFYEGKRHLPKGLTELLGDLTIG